MVHVKFEYTWRKAKAKLETLAGKPEPRARLDAPWEKHGAARVEMRLWESSSWAKNNALSLCTSDVEELHLRPASSTGSL